MDVAVASLATQHMVEAVPSRSPVMIIGTERSGSNLLRLVLNAHSQIAIPHPPHFMRYFAPIVGRYGDLADEGNRAALVRDAISLLRHHIHPWPCPIDPDRVVAAAGPHLFSIVAAIYDQYRIAEGKARWGCKSTFMVDHVAEVVEECPQVRFIWLVRDPRDVAASAKHAVFGSFHPYLTARLWNTQQHRGLAALASLGPGSVRLQRYESLVCDPEQQVKELCDFVGVPFEAAMLEHHLSAAAREVGRLSQSWRNAARPISAERVGGHVRTLTPRQRVAVEAVTGAMMTRLGYAVQPPATPPSQPSLLRVYAADLLLRAQVEWRSLRRDKNHWRRWGRAVFIGWLRVRTRVRAALRTPTRPRRPGQPPTTHPTAGGHPHEQS